MLITRGMRVIGSFSEEQARQFLKLVIESVDSLGDLDVRSVSKQLGIAPDEAGTAISASSLLVAIASSRVEGGEEITGELVKAGLLQDDERQQTSRVISALFADREAIRTSFDVAELAGATLPSFRYLHTSLDVRMNFDESGLQLAVPVIVASLNTDDDPSNTFFQMKRSDVVRLAEQFASLKEQIEAAETWISKK